MLYDLVVGPAMHRIGELWAAGEIGVGQEHLATQIATQVLALAHEVAELSARRAEHRVMLAAAEGEYHVIALDMAAKLLESAGYEVLTLGADVPTNALADIVADHDPALFVLSATMPEAGERVPAAIDAVTAAGGDIGLILGGVSIPRSLVLGRGWSWSRRSPAWSRRQTRSCAAPGSTNAMEQRARDAAPRWPAASCPAGRGHRWGRRRS